ncbi:MAG: polysaccharide deacetylase family protein [Thermoleophilia bacterium]
MEDDTDHPRRTLLRTLVMFLLLGPAVFGWACADADTTTSTPTSVTTGPSTSVAPTTTTITWATTTQPSTTTTAAPTTTTGPPTTIAEGGVEYVRLPGDTKRVAFTFDAAYDPAPLSSILATLRKEGVPATFFFTGEFVEDFPESVAAVVASGAPIGNHSYSHPDFTKISPDEARSQLRRTATLLTEAGAEDPRPLFRFPYGARDKTTSALVASEGYVSVYWTIDTLDWKPQRTAQEIYDVVMSRLSPGAIVLMHVGGKQTAAILPSLINDIRARGYEFVDLRTALR